MLSLNQTAYLVDSLNKLSKNTKDEKNRKGLEFIIDEIKVGIDAELALWDFRNIITMSMYQAVLNNIQYVTDFYN